MARLAKRLILAAAGSALGACAASAQPLPASAEAPAAPAAAAAGRSGEIERLLLRADLVVMGQVVLGACRDGCQGRVEIDEVLVGDAAGTVVGFVAAPPRHPGASAGQPLVVFLARGLTDPSRWRLLLTDEQELGLPARQRDHVTATRLPRAVDAAGRRPFAARLAELKRDGRAGSVATARAVLSRLDVRGVDGAGLIELLGEPHRRERTGDAAVWLYHYRDGDQGLIAKMWMRGGVVAAVTLLE